jgi:hypothetical protein
MTAPDIPRLRLARQRLIGERFDSAEDAVRWLTAVQAQDYGGVKWAIGQRVKDCFDRDVEGAYASGRIVRTHIMRPTWHFVMPEDIRWMQALTAPRVRAAIAYYDRQLELDSATLENSKAAIGRALAGGNHLTRSEISGVLDSEGITGTGQRIGHLLIHAELDALICSGVMRGKQHTYALLEERAPGTPTLPRDEALAELTRRYFTGHGPALVHDFAWWSGLTVADARSGIEMAKPHLVSEMFDGKTYWSAPSPDPPAMDYPTVHVLPNYDQYLIAYKERAPSLHPPLPNNSKLLYDVLSRHFIVLNGRVVGGWRNVPAGKDVVIETRLLVPLDEVQTRSLRAATDA